MGSSSPVRDVQRQFLVNSRDMNRFLEGVSTWSDEVKSEDTAILQDSVEKKNSTLDAVREPHDNAGQGRAGVKYDVAATIDTVDSMLQQEKLFGDACFQQGDYETAKKYYSRCANNRCTASIYVNLSLCEMKLQSWAEAETYCSEALRLDPKHLKALQRRGVAQRELGKHLCSTSGFEQTTRLAPDSSVLRRERAKSKALFEATRISKPAQSRGVKLRFSGDTGCEPVCLLRPKNEKNRVLG